MSVSIIDHNKKRLELLIDIMSEHIQPTNYFTYNGKPILNKITFNSTNDLSKIYYKSSSLNQFIKEIKDGKYNFIVNQYNKSCIQRIYNNISETKCMSIIGYINNENIRINIINKSLNINPQIISFTLNENNVYDIIIEDIEDIEDIEKKKKENEKELSILTVIASALSSTIKSKKINDEIVSKFYKLYDKNI